MNKYIEILQFYYGCTKKQAREWLKSYTKERLQLLEQGYEEQLKRAFYED